MLSGVWILYSMAIRSDLVSPIQALEYDRQLCFCCLVDQLPEAGGADQRRVLREAEGGSDHFTTGVIEGEVHDGQAPLGKGEIVETDCAFDLVFAGGTIGRDGS